MKSFFKALKGKTIIAAMLAMLFVAAIPVKTYAAYNYYSEMKMALTIDDTGLYQEAGVAYLWCYFVIEEGSSVDLRTTPSMNSFGTAGNTISCQLTSTIQGAISIAGATALFTTNFDGHHIVAEAWNYCGKDSVIDKGYRYISR